MIKKQNRRATPGLGVSLAPPFFKVWPLLSGERDVCVCGGGGDACILAFSRLRPRLIAAAAERTAFRPPSSAAVVRSLDVKGLPSFLRLRSMQLARRPRRWGREEGRPRCTQGEEKRVLWHEEKRIFFLFSALSGRSSAPLLLPILPPFLGRFLPARLFSFRTPFPLSSPLPLFLRPVCVFVKCTSPFFPLLSLDPLSVPRPPLGLLLSDGLGSEAAAAAAAAAAGSTCNLWGERSGGGRRRGGLFRLTREALSMLDVGQR